jgi:hypothetical protein
MKRKDRALERKAHARFFDNGRRILLMENQERRFYRSDKTEEGWDSQDEWYTFIQDTVYLMVHTDGRDCDGRVSTTSHFSALLSSRDRKGRLDWKHGHKSQRDYAAEAAGY